MQTTMATGDNKQPPVADPPAAPSPTRTPSPGPPQPAATRAALPTDERSTETWNIQENLLARNEMELARLHREVALLRQANAHVPATVQEEPGAVVAMHTDGKHVSVASNGLAIGKGDKLPDVHVRTALLLARGLRGGMGSCDCSVGVRCVVRLVGCVNVGADTPTQ